MVGSSVVYTSCRPHARASFLHHPADQAHPGDQLGLLPTAAWRRGGEATPRACGPSGGADDDGGSGVQGGAAAGCVGGGCVGAESKAWHTAPVVMQVVDTVGIPPLAVRHSMPGGRVERYSMVLSDGLHTMEIKLITPLRHLVRDG